MILLHPRIYTLDPARCTPANPWGQVQALRIDAAGFVTAAGDRADVLARREPGEATREPLAACVLPGLIDTHAHLSSLGMRPGSLELPDDASPQEWAHAVAQRAAGLRPGAWITGRGWNQTVWEPGDAELVEGFATHALLSQAAPENPVLLHRADHHAVWVNRAALALAGLLDAAPQVEGGRAVCDAQGRPTGVLIDEAIGLIEAAMPPLDAQENQALIRERARMFLAQGVTCVHCALIPPAQIPHYQAEIAQGRAGLRVRGMLYDAPEALGRYASQRWPHLDPQGWLHLSTLKAFADGALGSQGAWMLDPYQGSELRGGPVATPQQMEQLARHALENHWQLATHAIGDQALRQTLAAWRRAGLTPERARALGWRVEHVQHATPEDLDTLASMGLAAAMQPIHCTRDMRFVEPLLGPQRAAWSYPWAEVLRRNIPLGFGSDYPIETLSPWEGLHAALTRQDERGRPEGGWHPQHRVTRAQALAAYTTEGASLMPFDAGRLGHLGQLGDLVTLDTDPTEASPQALRQTKVLATLTAGRLVHGSL